MTSHARHITNAFTAAVLLFALAASDASAQRRPRAPRTAKPTGAEIALRARSARLDRGNAGMGEFQGKRIAFTPAMLDARADLSAGQVVGLLENDVAGDETGLPPGKYNVFAAQLADGWHVYAESGGQIVREALRVTVSQKKDVVAAKKPRIRPVGWGVDIDRSTSVDVAPVASISIVSSGTTLYIGQQQQYGIELRDESGNLLTGRAITWTTSASAVATAPSRGVAQGVAAGTAAFTATSEGKSAQLMVQVPALQYALNLGGVAYQNGVLTATTSMAGSTSLYASPVIYSCVVCPAVNWADLTWSTSAPGIATVTRGSGGQAIIKGIAVGTATITASYHGIVRPVTVTVGPARTASIVLSPSPLSVAAGQTQQVGAVVRDATGAIMTDRPITWSSSTPSIADVTSTGRVAGVTVGQATVYATVDGVASSVPVTVTRPPVATVTVSPATLSVEQNLFSELTATLRDASGTVLTDRSVIWTSSNTAIADVTVAGRVIGVAPGSATITATSEGRSARSAVTVTASTVASTEQMTEQISFNW